MREVKKSVVKEKKTPVLDRVVAVLDSTAQRGQELRPVPGHIEPGRLGNYYCKLHCNLVHRFSHSLYQASS